MTYVCAPRVNVGIFRGAITEADNVTINVGYLSLFWILVLVLGTIPVMIVASCLQFYYDAHHVFPFAELGKGVGLVTGGFATALGALGFFIMGDSRKPVSPNPTVVVDDSPATTVVDTAAPPRPQPVGS